MNHSHINRVHHNSHTYRHIVESSSLSNLPQSQVQDIELESLQSSVFFICDQIMQYYSSSIVIVVMMCLTDMIKLWYLYLDQVHDLSNHK